MIHKRHLSKKLSLLLAPVTLLFLASCGSYEYAGYEDGIYGSSERTATGRSQEVTTDSNSSSYYKNLFAEKSALYGDALAESPIFTDVDDYTSTGDYDEEAYLQDEMAYSGGYAPWGEDPDEYSINIYNNGFNRFYSPWRMGGWGWGNPHFGYGFGYGGFWGDPFFDPYWGGGMWGQPWGGGMWGHPWSVGFNNFGPWGWGTRFGFGYGLGYGGFYSPYFYNRGFGYPMNGQRYNQNVRDVAYNEGRRNAVSSYTRGESRRSNAILNSRSSDRRNSSYSRSIRNVRDSRNGDYGVRRQGTTTRSRSTRVTREGINTQRTRVNSNTNRRNLNINRSNNNTRTRSFNTRSAPVRSSGSMRSSGGSVRSSGGAVRSSGGRGGRGR